MFVRQVWVLPAGREVHYYKASRRRRQFRLEMRLVIYRPNRTHVCSIFAKVTKQNRKVTVNVKLASNSSGVAKFILIYTERGLKK